MTTKTIFHTYPNLEEVQGIILKPHGRDYVRCIFLKFKNDAQRIRRWMSEFAKTELTTAAEQNKQATKFRNKRLSGGHVTTGLYLSKHAYEKMNISEECWPQDGFYKNGMSTTSGSSAIHDPPLGKWDPFFQNEIDAMVLLAGNDKCKLEVKTEYILDTLSAIVLSKNHAIEYGKRLYHRFGRKKLPIEPFGFRDGLSQPRFFHHRYKNQLMPNRWRLAIDDFGGSYLVFRKLEQDVVKFNQKISELANLLDVSREMAEAQVVGRFKDGTPLTLFPSPREVRTKVDFDKLRHFDEFSLDDERTAAMNYELDTHGDKCPFHAHIRKVNPRNQLLIPEKYQGTEKQIQSRIVRRGIPYAAAGGKVGLLFMSFQASIIDQFHRIQQSWSNNPKFTSLAEPEWNEDYPKPGLDPIIGQAQPANVTGTVKIPQQQWNRKWGVPGQTSFDFSKVVTMRGGVFLYAPAVPFLQGLADLPKNSV